MTLPTERTPETWHCRFCSYGEYVNSEPDRAARRKADHEAQCPSNPGHPLHGHIAGTSTTERTPELALAAEDARLELDDLLNAPCGRCGSPDCFGGCEVEARGGEGK